MGERICKCGKTMTIQNKNLIREIGGKKRTIIGVPILYCENCKEVLYKAKTIKKIDELLKAFPEKDTILYAEFSVDIYTETIRKLDITSNDYLDSMDKPANYANLISVLSHFNGQTA